MDEPIRMDGGFKPKAIGTITVAEVNRLELEVAIDEAMEKIGDSKNSVELRLSHERYRELTGLYERRYGEVYEPNIERGVD